MSNRSTALSSGWNSIRYRTRKKTTKWVWWSPCLMIFPMNLVLAGIRNGAKGYLLKDVSLEELVNAIARGIETPDDRPFCQR